MAAMRRVDMRACGLLRVVDEGIAGFSGILALNLSRCRKLWKLPKEIGRLTQLQKLDLDECR